MLSYSTVNSNSSKPCVFYLNRVSCIYTHLQHVIIDPEGKSYRNNRPGPVTSGTELAETSCPGARCNEIHKCKNSTNRIYKTCTFQPEYLNITS